MVEQGHACPDISRRRMLQSRTWSLSWISSSRFGDKFLRRRARESKKKKMNMGKFWIRKSCAIYVLCQASLLRNTASYILFAGREWDRES